MSKKQCRAYKPVTVTDGITSWTKHTFDNTVEWTPDDFEKFKSGMVTLTPHARITRMQAYLDNLENVTPAIKLHVDAIRAIYAGLDNHYNVDEKGLYELDRAEWLWKKIIILRDVMPRAAQGVAQSKRMSDIASRPRSVIPLIAKELVKNYPKYKAEELWQYLSNELKDRGLDPEEETNKKGCRLYRYFKSELSEKTKTISFESFSNILSKIGNKKSQ